MIFLFEDKEDDKLSNLWRQSFTNEKIKIVYANGNGCLIKVLEELLKQDDIIIVFLDTIPANKSIRDIYVEIRRMSRKNDFRIIVWNIVCAEYYFIKAFATMKDLKAFNSQTDLELILNKCSYRESKLIQNEEDKIFTKTFEKFCKLFIHKNGNECINKSKTFFELACKDNECLPLSLQEKSDLYRIAYECGVIEHITIDEAWRIHRKLLQETNNMIEEYNNQGYLKIKTYPEIC